MKEESMSKYGETWKWQHKPLTAAIEQRRTRGGTIAKNVATPSSNEPKPTIHWSPYHLIEGRALALNLNRSERFARRLMDMFP